MQVGLIRVHHLLDVHLTAVGHGLCSLLLFHLAGLCLLGHLYRMHLLGLSQLLLVALLLNLQLLGMALGDHLWVLTTGLLLFERQLLLLDGQLTVNLLSLSGSFGLFDLQLSLLNLDQRVLCGLLRLCLLGLTFALLQDLLGSLSHHA